MAIKIGLALISCTLIVEGNAKPNHKITPNHDWWHSMTPLMLAIFNDHKMLTKDGQEQVICELLKCGATPNHHKQ